MGTRAPVRRTIEVPERSPGNPFIRRVVNPSREPVRPEKNPERNPGPRPKKEPVPVGRQ